MFFLKKHLQLLVRVIGSAALILWIIKMIDWGKIIGISREASWYWLVAAFLAIQITVLPSIWKWKLLIKEKSESGNVSLLKLGRFYYIGLFFNNFLPGSVGGDVIRVYYLGRITGLAKAAASVAFERLTSGVALIGIALLSSLFLKTSKAVTFSVLLVTGALVVLFVVLALWMKKRPNKVTTSGYDGLSGMRKLRMNTGKAIANVVLTVGKYRNKGLYWWILVGFLSVLFQVGMAWINQLLFLAFGIEISWLDLLMIISLISVITMLPVSVNGIGVREGSYVFFFHQLGVPSEIAVAVSLLFFFLVSVSSLAGGLFWISERGRQSEAVREQAN
jgi:uncharacterized protein (TIRG00374 family)